MPLCCEAVVLADMALNSHFFCCEIEVFRSGEVPKCDGVELIVVFVT